MAIFHSNAINRHPSTWIAPGAVVVGDVSLGERSSVWYGCVIRGDVETIRVGNETNIQDQTTVHVDHGMSTMIGDRVTVGHRSIVHGCVIEDDAVIGMGAVVLSGARIGRGALVAAGAVVLEGTQVPPGAIFVGVPARKRGDVEPELRERFALGVATYVESAARYRTGELGGGAFGGAPTEGRR